MSEKLTQLVAHLATAPPDHVDGFVKALRHQGGALTETASDRVVETLPTAWQQTARRAIQEVTASGHAPRLDCLATATAAASLARREATRRQVVELVWSGPPQSQSTFRRTDRAWVDLIDEAAVEVWIASFSVGSIERIQQAAISAIERGVTVRFLLERTSSSNGAIRYDGFRAFDQRLASHATFYHWPLEQRELDSNGNPGLMHAKAVVADAHAMFVTSANLSGAALERNIEVGVIVRGGPQPRWLAERFNMLVETDIVSEFSLT